MAKSKSVKRKTPLRSKKVIRNKKPVRKTPVRQKTKSKRKRKSKRSSKSKRRSKVMKGGGLEKTHTFIVGEIINKTLMEELININEINNSEKFNFIIINTKPKYFILYEILQNGNATNDNYKIKTIKKKNIELGENINSLTIRFDCVCIYQEELSK